MAVRSAKLDDLPLLKELSSAFRFAHKTGMKLPYDEDSWVEWLSNAILRDDYLILILDEGKGFFVGAISATPFAPMPVAYELVWYTFPEAKGRGSSLFRAYLRWAKEKNVEYIFCTMPEPSAALERLGFEVADVGYFKHTPRPPALQAAE